MIGLSDVEIKKLQAVFDEYGEIQKVILFGSRAMENFKKSSDIDIALIGKNNITINKNIINRIDYELNEESSLPYFFDVVDIKKISNEKLEEHIEKYGLVLYEEE